MGIEGAERLEACRIEMLPVPLAFDSVYVVPALMAALPTGHGDRHEGLRFSADRLVGRAGILKPRVAKAEAGWVSGVWMTRNSPGPCLFGVGAFFVTTAGAGWSAVGRG